MNTHRVSQLEPDASMIDLGIGQPAFDLLPLDLLREAAAERLSQGDTAFLNYGYEQGDGYFRQALARFLQQQAGYDASPEMLMVTSGASQALDMICTHFARPGDTVFVEEPTYFLALRIMNDRRLNVVSVPTGADGLDLDALEALLARQRPAFLYTVPTFQNPSGVTLPAAQRERLLSLAQAHDFYVVADEVYHLLDYGEAPPPPLGRYASGGRVLSLGSFSKILAPGLRLGWIQAAPTLLQRLTGSGLLDSGGGLNPFTANVVRPILEQGRLAPHIAWLKEIYSRRSARMDAALQQNLGDGVYYAKPKGGFFFWVALPQEAQALLSVARQHGVAFQPGSKFSASGGCRTHARLCFAFYDEATIERGVARLAKAIDRGGD